MMRPAVDGCSRIEQHSVSMQRGYGRGQRGPVDARQHAERGVGRHHGGAGVSSAEKRHGVPGSDCFGRHPYRRARFPAQRSGGCRIHGHDVGRVNRAKVNAGGAAVALELAFDLISRPDQREPTSEMSRGNQRTRDDVLRRVVTTSRVNGNVHRLGIPDRAGLTRP